MGLSISSRETGSDSQTVRARWEPGSVWSGLGFKGTECPLCFV